jgi:ProP effector
MTMTAPDATANSSQTPAAATPVTRVPASRAAQPVLEKLFELYPHLFGAEFYPLKLGIFQELLALHPDQFERASLKLALGVHTRSTRYLQCVASGKPRHDLQGVAVGPVAPEHVYLSAVELFRRRQARTQEDLRPKLHRQLLAALEASGLSNPDYLALVQTHEPQADEVVQAVLVQVLAERANWLAKQAALMQAFEASAKTPAEFADMYGLALSEVLTMVASRKI